MAKYSKSNRRRAQYGKRAASVILCSLVVAPKEGIAETGALTKARAPIVSALAGQTSGSISKIHAPDAAANGGSLVFWGRSGADGKDDAPKLDIDLTGEILAPVTIRTSDGPGIEAVNSGQSGGKGGGAFNASAILYSSGGDGGRGGKGGDVSITTRGAGSINTTGQGGHGIVARARGGDGGDGGDVTSLGLGFNSGGDGGGGGGAGNVVVNSSFDISTSGRGASGILARSSGGGGGSGGSMQGLGISGNGGHGADAASGGAVYVSHTGNISTQGVLGHGILAQSLGGNAGKGGDAFGIVALAGHGSGASIGAPVTVEVGVGSAITTSGANASAILAQSISGRGGDGGKSGGIAPGGGGGADAAIAGAVVINNGGRLVTSGDYSGAMVAQSIGGAGGSGGGAGGVFVADAGNAGGAGNGGRIQLNNTGDITTYGVASDGIVAQSIGGGGGNGGVAMAVAFAGAVSLGGGGGSGGAGGSVCVNGNVDCSGAAENLVTTTIQTSGDRSAGIVAQSIGGGGGNGGFAIAAALGVEVPAISVALGARGGHGGAGGNVVVGANGQILTRGNSAAGIDASSVGGGGGRGGFAISGSASADIGAISVALGGAGGAGDRAGSVTVDTRVDVATLGDNATGISASSTGGGGGNGGFAIDGALSPGVSLSVALGSKGGQGASGGDVLLRNTGSISTGDARAATGANSAGLLAQSIGGGGGNGGFAIAAAASSMAGARVSLGGDGGMGAAGGAVRVDNNDSAIISNRIVTQGANAVGLLAQSIGGGGGNAGFSVGAGVSSSGSLSLELGGKGQTGATGGGVAVSSFGQIATMGDNSGSIIAQSVGGGGGDGAFSAAIAAGSSAVSVSLGGAGGKGGAAGAVTVATAGYLSTHGAHSNGVTAQSVGGGGGNGGFTGAGTGGSYGALTLNLGGAGGNGGSGGDVTVTSNGAIHTAGAQSSGVFAQSIGGGGGSGGFAVSATGAASKSATMNVGGSGVSGGKAGAVTVNNTAQILTEGDMSYGAAAQSIGGGGGNAGLSIAAAVSRDGKGYTKSVGGDSVDDSPGGNVILNHANVIETRGAGSIGILAQSVGGGGGSGGFAIGLVGGGNSDSTSNATGGKGGKGSFAGDVKVTSQGAVRTSGANASGIVAQSIGGGGGIGGFSLSGGFSSSAKGTSNATGGVGGKGGAGADVNVVNLAMIETGGLLSHGMLIQSIGGGGGSGGFAIAGTLSIGDDGAATATGGIGGAGQFGGTINVSNSGNIVVKGDGSIAIVAQSIGGGGGDGGMAGGIAINTKSKGIASATGGDGGDGNNGGAVTAVNSATLVALGANGGGVMAQSIGGGGGNGGITGASALTLEANAAIVATGGHGGSAGNGARVSIENDIKGAIGTSGAQTFALMAQSIGGGGGNGGATIGGAVSLKGQVKSSVGGGIGGAAGIGGAVSIKNAAILQVDGANSRAITAQSIGGGGGNGGLVINGSLTVDGEGVTTIAGGDAGSNGTGGVVTVENSGSIRADGAGAVGILAQSVGGGGGNGGFVVSGNVALAGPASSTVGAGIGGARGHGGAVSLINSGDLLTTGDNAPGMLVQSIGGGGGNGGFATGGAFSAAHGAANASASGKAEDQKAAEAAALAHVGGAGGTAGDGATVTVESSGVINTRGKAASGLLAQSIGGGGGAGGFVVAGDINLDGTALSTVGGGAGGAAGRGGDVVVTLTEHSNVKTIGDMAQGVVAQSIGGGGGHGGFSAAASFHTTGDINVTVGGGTGGSGGNGGQISIHNAGVIETSGANAIGLTAQSIGGGGGTGGFAGSLGVSASKSLHQTTGGAGALSGSGSIVRVDNSGNIATKGANSIAVMAQSIGGGGGAGGLAIVGAVTTGAVSSNAVGGAAGASGDSGGVEIENRGWIRTLGDIAHGLVAQAIGGGGGGGAGGMAFGGGLSTGGEGKTTQVGGSGGAAGSGGVVSVVNAGDIYVAGKLSAGILAQSIGGGGGAAGFGGGLSIGSNGTLVSSTGAKAGSGGGGGEVKINNTGTITTRNDGAPAMIAQSIGGGGGLNAYALDLTRLITGGAFVTGGEKSSGGDGGGVSVHASSGAITTAGSLSQGLVAQSIGGGGGGVTTLTSQQWLRSEDVYMLLGGFDGSNGDGSVVDVVNASQIATSGTGASGIITQSIGGGGGISGLAEKGSGTDTAEARVSGVQLGGSNSWGDGGGVSLSSTGSISTHGVGAAGLVAQSIGGGGGMVSTSSVHANSDIQLGASNGGGGNGGAVRVSNAGAIVTSGNQAIAIVAQSIGGGGGLYVSDAIYPKALEPSFAGGHGATNDQGDDAARRSGGNGASVEISNSGAIRTNGIHADGIVAQSIGGGGGLAGAFMGSVGGVGTGAGVSVHNSGRIEVTGIGARGIFGQSAGGTGAAGVAISTNADVLATGAGGIGIVGVSQAGSGSGGDVAVNVEGATVQGGVGGRAVQIETRGIGKLVNTGHLLTSDGQTGVAVAINASTLEFTNKGKITGDIALGGGAVMMENDQYGVIYSGRNIAPGAGGTFVNRGDVMPGGDQQVLQTTIAGQYEQSGTGQFLSKLALGDNQADQLEVKGTAFLRGGLRVSAFEPGFARPGAFETQVLHADDGVHASGLNLIPAPTAVASFDLRYPDGNRINLGYAVDFMPEALRLNQRAIGATINSIQTANNHSAFSPVTGFVFNIPTLGLLESAYADLSGESLTASQSATFAAMDGFGGDVMNAARNSSGSSLEPASMAQQNGAVASPGRLWASSGGGSGGQTGKRPVTGSAGETHFYSGLTAGADYTFANGALAGVALGMSQGKFTVEERNTSGETTHMSASAYGRLASGDTYVVGMAAVGAHQFDTTRLISGIGPTERASGSAGGKSLNFHTELGHHFAFGCMQVSPFASADLKILRIGGFNESASHLDGSTGLMGLAVRTQRSRSLESQSGVELRTNLPLSGGGVLSPWVRAAWAHEFSAGRNISAAFRSAPGFNFSTAGARAPVNQARIGVGMTAESGAISVDAHGEVTLSERRADWRGTIEAKYRF